MNGKELHVHVPRPFPSVLGLAFMLCLTGFGERALFAQAPAPHVRFDQTVTPPASICSLATTKPPDVPPQVLIGEPFTFRVRFNNGLLNGLPPPAAGAIAGYGPFIDLVLDAGGANIKKTTQSCACDGMTFVSANMIDVNGGAVPLVSHQSLALCLPSPSQVSLNHPFAAVQPVQVPAGSQLVTLELPFGSFDPTQPEIVVEVTAYLSPLADVVSPPYALKIYARGGFRYGADALDNANTLSGDWPVLSDVIVSGNPPSSDPTNQKTDSTQWAAWEPTAPTVMIVSKKYLGPENETATGPNFIQQYQLTLDIANGQTVNNVTVTDFLPGNMAYHATVPPTTPCFLPPFSVPTPPDQAYIGSVNWEVWKCASITGGAHPDATIVFQFFIPEKTGDGFFVLDPLSCDPVQSTNGVEAEGTWLGPTPSDPCDSHPVPVSSIMYPDPRLMDKCIAIQKTVVDITAPSPSHPLHPIPGDTLLYTLTFQLSDFRTAGNLTVQDILSDGQTLVPGSLLLTVTDQCNTFPATTATTSGPIPATAVTQTTLLCGAGAPPPLTQLDIDVSAAMTSLATAAISPPGPFRHQHGIFTGGHSFAPTPLFTVPARGTITFHTTIDDAYQCSVASPHDLYVDKDDPLSNTVTLTADILPNGGTCSTKPSPPTGVVAQDDSKTCIAIVTDFLEKTVYQVQAAAGHPTSCGPIPPCPSKPEVYPGDLVTFRLKKTIPSSDAENLTIQDWLPLPVLPVPSTFSLAVPLCSGTPLPGNACQVTIPSWTYAIPPMTLSLPPFTNSIKFTYGTFYDSINTPRDIDLLFTLTVSTDPFADGLYLTNEAQECESNTFGATFCQTAIAQVHVREPALKITKGVVAASNPNAVFTPSQVGPVTFNPPGSTSCPRFTGTINHTNLATTPINSDISSVDANDCVTFAIVVENTGGSPAYDIKLADFFPPGALDIPDCFVPDFNTLCVRDGAGNLLGSTHGPSFHGNAPITLSSPLPGVGATPAGSNIAVITFDACVVANIIPHCCDNTAQVANYASTLNGPNFVAAGFTPPFQDSAQICVRPTGTKSITSTSEAHTSETLVPRPLAIGEIIRYHLDVVVPETTSASNYKVQDLLPPGLIYIPGTITVIPPWPAGVTQNPISASPLAPPCGASVTFDLGSISNLNNNPAQEVIALEFNALVCNNAYNQNGAALSNSFNVLVANQIVATSNTVPAVVVEPKITIKKVVTSVLPSLVVTATATYTITLTNSGTATAFDVRLTDQLPGCLSNLFVSPPYTNTNLTGTMLDVTIASIPVNGTVTVTYKATVSCIDCRRLINTAKITWTSLPGPFGTTANLTNSSTPGASGFPNGERDGSGGVINDYVASATASLCCMLVSNEKINCNPDGTFTYTFVVTNFSNAPSFGVNFLQLAGVTITPNPYVFPVTLFPTGLPPLGSAQVTVTIDPGAVSGPTICFIVELGSTGPIPGCETQVCIDLPKCCVQPPSAMVAWWPLDETAGSGVADISGHLPSHSGISTPGAVNGSGPGSQAAEVNNGFRFCGTSSTSTYVTVPDETALNFGLGLSFSIDAWIRTSSTSKIHMIVDKLNWPNPNAGYRFYVDGTNKLKLDIAGGAFGGTSTNVLTPGSWYHVAVAVDRPNKLVTFYINGAAEPGGTDSTFMNASSSGLSLLIGGTHETLIQTQTLSACEYMLDEVEIFNRVLGLTEIQAIYNARSSGKCKPDLAITKRAANTPWTVGGTGTFTLLVQNLGSGAVPAGTVITVTENLQAGLTLNTVSGSGWTSTNNLGVVTCQYTVPPGGLAGGASLPLITFTVTVTAAGPFRNCAIVQGQVGGVPGAAGAVLQEPTGNNTSCITIPTVLKPSPVIVQIPVVLDVFGVPPSHYTSDLVAVNRSGASTPVTVRYFPSVYPTGAGTPVSLTLSSGLLSGREVRVPDVLAFLRANGYAPNSGPPEVGTLQLTFANVSDPSLVFAGSRTSTPNPNTTVGGNFGLFVTGTPVGLGPSLPATIFALREDTAYRSNLAIEDVPGSGTSQPVLKLQVWDGDTGSLSGAPITYPLAPGEWHQFNSILGSVANGYVTITQTGGSDSFLAYGVVNDGPASGGGTSDGSLVGTDGADGLVPIVLSVTSSGVLYTSELVLTNPTAVLAIATLTYTPAAALSGTGGPYTAYVLVAAGQQIRVADAITWLRDTFFMPLPANGVNQGGTLLVSGATAYVRTSNPNPDTNVGGTFGLAYPAVPTSGRATSEAWVYGLVQDAATRANAAIADARVGNPAVVTYVVDVFDAGTGSTTPVQTLTIPLAGGQWTQVSGILLGAGIAHGYVRVRPSSGASDYVVYGVLNDGASPGQGTSDGSYVAMSGVQ
jgi:uncharacterized repeat protein (TIGR01451 family)